MMRTSCFSKRFSSSQEDALLTQRACPQVWTVQLLYTGWGDNARLHKLVSGGRDGVRVWSVPEYTCLLHIPVDKGVTCVDIDPCTVVVSSFDKSIRVYDFDHRDDITHSDRMQG